MPLAHHVLFCSVAQAWRRCGGCTPSCPPLRLQVAPEDGPGATSTPGDGPSP